ncbi:MAG: maltose alpha-D-glucosyltransferase [Acidobacteriaceae bacterium]
MKKACSATDPLWYKDAIIYELHVRAFADSNADGIGDFQGLISKLDYLQELGVTCLWLLPFFPSPLRDDGYDIADYCGVNPSYGSIDDFKQFLDAAHLRNMQVMIELVINHTSDQHPWFQKARHAPPGSPERDMYVWSDTDKKYEGVRIIFTDTEKSNWAWDDVAKQYYWHRFFSHQPDLNFDNPKVMEEVLDAMRFWMDMGVDGLRLDAIPYLVERDGTSCENVPETHVKIKHIRAVMDAEYENRLILAEANMWPADVRPYFGDGDECNMAFHFPLMPRIYMALRQEDRQPITDIMAQTPDIPPSCQWGIFLRNHDELTLEMVTDDERDYMNLAYASDSRMRINVGIRRRLAPLMDNNRRRIELLNSLLLSFPGTPIMYYGDEIGMGDNIYLGDRNGVRTPMQWNSDRNAGFSRADPARLYFPVVMDPTYGYQSVNVEAQQSDPSSLLQWVRNMLALRKLFQVFGRGTLEFLHPKNRKVLAYIREYQHPNGEYQVPDTHSETVLCVANLSRFAQPVSLDLAKYAGRQPVEMLGYVPFPEVTAQPYPLTLAPYSFLWLELQPGAAAVSIDEGREMSVPVPITNVDADEEAEPLGIAAFLAGPGPNLLAEALPEYLVKQRWFGSKSRPIASVTLGNVELLEDINTALTTVVVIFADRGDSETYQLPLTIASGSTAETFRSASPNAIIATLNTAAGPALLHDAILNENFRERLLRLTSNAPEDIEVSSRLVSAEQSNSSILYGQQYILKLYRRLQQGENPDVEVPRFLTEVAHFDHIPAYLGHLQNRQEVTLAFLQAFAPNQGDGWQWMQAELTRFYESVASCPAPTHLGEPANFLTSPASSPEVRKHAATSLAAAALLGRRTAELHLSLATPTDDPAFSAEAFTPNDLAADSTRIHAQIVATLDAMKQNMLHVPIDLSPDTATRAASLLSQRKELLDRAHTLAIASPYRFGRRIRIHGDYHLGQVLRTESDFLIVDFEGEPARPLAERRRKQSPLRDVAGMMRSFSYAAHSALDLHTQHHPKAASALGAWATTWERAVSTAFLSAYREAIAVNPELIPQPGQAQALLLAFLLEKALYELLYELNNRPSWLGIPLGGVLSLLREAA